MIEEVVGKATPVQQPVVMGNGSGQSVAVAQKQSHSDGDRYQPKAVPLHDVHNAVNSINKALEVFNVERRFIVHQKSHQVVVKITDKQTGEVIMEVPPEEAIERYEKMQEFIGLLFNEKV